MYFKLKIISNLIGLRLSKSRYRKKVSSLQERRWLKLQGTLLQSPFYKDLASKKTPLKDYPLMNKANFMENFNTINTKQIDREEAFGISIKAEMERDFSPMINGITIGLSSGTSGNRGIFLASESERAQWVACVLDRVIGFSLKKRSVAFFLRANSNLYDSVKSKLLQFEFFDLLAPLTSQMNRLNSLNPTILVAQPSLLLELAKKKLNGELNINPLKIISVAEVLYPEDKETLEQVFNQKIHQVYQCTEGMLAATCKHGTLHFNEDFLVIEKNYIDNEETRFHPVITDLVRTSQPVIRYELNDIIHEMKNCPCGSAYTSIEKIEGRSDDVLCFQSNDQEIIIFPDFFRRAIITSSDTIHDYTLVQSNLNQLELYVDDKRAFSTAETAITQLLESYGIRNVAIRNVNSRHHEKGDKLRRIRNDYRKAN
jgi:putative adenylate-forming enzyme